MVGSDRKKREELSNMGDQPKDFTEQDDYYPILITIGQQCKPHLFLNFCYLSVKIYYTKILCAYFLFVCKTKEGSSRTLVAIKKKLQDAECPWNTQQFWRGNWTFQQCGGDQEQFCLAFKRQNDPGCLLD